MNKPAVFIASEKYRRHSYGGMHPLGIPRVSLTYDLIRAFNAMDSEEFIESVQATDEQLAWFHTEAYIQAMRDSEQMGKVLTESRKVHNIGNYENPYFPGFFTTPATATGGSIQGAEQVLQGKIAFSPAGGMHHAMPDQAHGFCFFNDPALAIMRLRQAGKRVLYVDIDAHHGDGVEYAFRDDEQVATFSIHMNTAYAYPFKGGNIEDRGELHNAFNISLPKACNDTEYEFVFNTSWLEVLNKFKPEVIVLQAGTDILMPDPLGKFNIATQTFLGIVRTIKECAPDGNLLVLGGGGYHPLALARCWLGVWGILSGRELPTQLTPEAREILQNVDWDMDEDEDYFAEFFRSRLDRPNSGVIRDEIRHIVDRFLQKRIAE